MSLHLFAGLRVRDYEAARPWYERLFGEPSFFPHATEAVWTLAEDRSVYVVEHAEGVTICAVYPDVDARHNECRVVRVFASVRKRRDAGS